MNAKISEAPVRKIARILGKPGRAAELRSALLALESATRTEEGCVEFAFYQSISSEHSFVLIEEFSGEQALRLHLELPHTRRFFEAGLVEKVEAFNVPPIGRPLPAERG